MASQTFPSATIMEFLKIWCIITAVFCIQAESQDCSSTYPCPRDRGDEPRVDIECEKVCDFIPDCGQGEDEAQCGTFCTFEGGTCNWDAVPSNRYTWSKGNGQLNDQSNLGPAVDQSVGNSTGGYLYVQENGNGTAPLAELRGPTLHNTAETCKFSFYYHLNQDDAWQLEVLLQTNYTTRLIKNIGSSWTGSRLWKKKYVTIGRVMGFAKVILRASKLDSSLGAVAIDSIEFRTEGCALAYDTGVNCTSDEWQCANGGCIPKNKLCDFVQHCRDGSDETDCADRKRCDAEANFCNFTNTGDPQWQRVAASSSPADSNWPITDHTFMTRQGSFFAVNGTTGGTSRAVFLGPPFKGITQGESECKMSLFFQSAGQNSRITFGFRTLYSRVDRTSLQVSRSQEQSWDRTELTFRTSTDFEPLIIAEPGVDGVIAIDDIIFSEGCLYTEPEIISDGCTFENASMPLCSWKQDEMAGQLQWGIAVAREAGRMGAIKLDHTNQDLAGHYLYLDSTEGEEGLSARLLSELYQPGACQMILWYYLGGSNVNKLTVYTRTSTVEGALQLEWRVSGAQGSSWREAVIPINRTSVFQIVIEGSAGTFTTNMDHIGIDDIGFNIPCVAADEGATLLDEIDDERDCSDAVYSCTDDTCSLDGPGIQNCPMECSFDNGYCGWTNDVTVAYQWSNSASLPGYGPTSDHTSQGEFLFINAKDLPPYQAAQLVSPRWPLSNLNCQVSIWYYHFAYNYGSLALRVKPEQGPVREVYTLHSHKSDYNQWTQIVADVPKCLSSFQILLTAQNSYGTLQHGGFAVDDFSLTCSQPTCSADNQCSSGGHCFTPSQKCDLTVDCCEDSTDEDGCDDYNLCSFEDDFCIWQQDSADGVQWTMQSQKTKRAPHTDVAGIPANDGSFIQVEFEDGMKGATSAVHSYIMSSVAGECELRFVYFTESSTSLRVLLRHSLGEENTKQVWKSSLSGSWQRAVISLSSGEPFEVVFEASSVSMENGVIGVDSTSFTPSCEITDSYLKPESKGNSLTAVFIFVIGILVCSALLIVLVISLKSKKKAYYISENHVNDEEEESKMM